MDGRLLDHSSPGGDKKDLENMAKNVVGQYISTKDIIMDCAKIRSTPDNDLIFRCDWMYEMSEDAISSERLTKKPNESTGAHEGVKTGPEYKGQVDVQAMSEQERNGEVKYASKKEKLKGSKARAGAIRSLSSWR